MYKISYKRYFKKIGGEYGLQPELLRGEIEHLVIIKSKFADLKRFWKSNLNLGVLCLAFMYATHSLEMIGFEIRDC